MIRTVPEKHYIQPSSEEVRSRFNDLGFTLPYSYDLVVDLANAFSHVSTGRSVEESLIDLGNYDLSEEALTYHSNVQRFVSSLNWSEFTGNTPLEVASSVVAALSQQEGGQPEEGADGMPLPIFSDGDTDPSEVASKIEEQIEQLDAGTDSVVAKQYLKEELTKGKEMALMSLTKEQKAIVANLAVLGKRGKIVSRKRLSSVRSVQMSSHSQVGRLQSASSMVMPSFGYKFATKQLNVRENISFGKQKLIVIIDNSSSMDMCAKMAWVKSLLLNRLQAVVDGKAELYVLPFLTSVYEESTVRITCKEEAFAVIARLKDSRLPLFSYSGGSTNVKNSVQETEKLIDEGFFGDHDSDFQIVIMNDGDDTVTPFKPKNPTHAFILGQDNEGLEKVIKSSGGHYERFL
jgi:Mg-chelatase subunit ChlD